MKYVETCLMFIGEQAGKAEEAINLYTSLFADSAIVDLDRYGPGEHEPEGSIRVGRFTLGGVGYRAMDSHLDHKFAFTPAFSVFVECESLEELETAYATLSDGGKELMPLGDYGFSTKFGWTEDRYGVSWQLNCSG